MYLIEDFARHIEFIGFGTYADNEHAGNIFFGEMPDSPHDCICVLSNDSGHGGSDSGARVQVVVRATTTKEAYELSQDLVEQLVDFDGYLHGDGAHVFVDLINASIGLGVDNRGRKLYASNFRIHYCNY